MTWKSKIRKGEKGSSLIDTVLALVLLGIIGVAFLSALSTTSTARATADERATSKILAESLMEQIKKDAYADSYEVPTISDEFAGYTAEVVTENIRNGEIQQVTITVSHQGQEVFSLENYKVDR